jgi:hypothetical protein
MSKITGDDWQHQKRMQGRQWSGTLADKGFEDF